MKSFTAVKNDEGVRLLRFVEKQCPNMPKGLIRKAFRNKRIKINGKKQSEDYRIMCGDLIEMEFLGNSYNPNLGSAISLVLMVLILISMGIMNQFSDGEDATGGVLL